MTLCSSWTYKTRKWRALWVKKGTWIPSKGNDKDNMTTLTKPNDHVVDGRFWRLSKPIHFNFMLVRVLWTFENEIA